MGYRGKVDEQERARELRAQGWTYAEICAELGVARSSVSLWVRDVAVDPDVAGGSAEGSVPRREPVGNEATEPAAAREGGGDRAMPRRGAAWLGSLSERDLFVAGIALYAGEGGKTGGAVGSPTATPMIVFTWLRRFFEIDESVSGSLYLHQASTSTPRPSGRVDGDPDRSSATVPASRPRSAAKHPMGCASIIYSSSITHRRVMGLVDGLLSAQTNPG